MKHVLPSTRECRSDEFAYDSKTGAVDLADLESKLDESVAAVIVQVCRGSSASWTR